MESDLVYREYSVPIKIEGTPEEVEEFWRNVKRWNEYWRDRMDREIATDLFRDYCPPQEK